MMADEGEGKKEQTFFNRGRSSQLLVSGMVKIGWKNWVLVIGLSSSHHEKMTKQSII